MKKYEKSLKEQAFALLCVDNNVSRVARRLNLPRTTVSDWKREFEREQEPSIVSIRQRKRAEFAEKAWEIVEDSVNVIKHRIERALVLEDRMDIIANAITENADALSSDVVKKNLSEIVKELQSVSVLRTNELTTLFGVMYDKHALASGENTENVGLNVKTFEDF